MVGKIEIRLATPEDAEGIATVHVRTWQYAYKGLMPDELLTGLSIEKRTEGWRKSLENPKSGVYAIVAVAGGMVVGWCTLGANRDEDAGVGIGELHGIYVLPEYIGRGVGSKLMDRALEMLRKDGYAKATLWVLDTNEKTRKWYEAKGWKIEGGKKIEKREGFDLNEVRYIVDL